MVSAEDKIQQDYLSRLAIIFQQNHPEWSTSELIMKQVENTLDQSSVACDTVINYLDHKLS